MALIMKKWLIALLTLLALSLSVAFAAEANDITEDCKFKVCSSGRKYTLMTDKKYTSYWESNKINYRAGGQANCRALCLLRQHA